MPTNRKWKTSDHEFYVYYQENLVYARRRTEPPVIARTCETPQEAADFVQSVINPNGLRHDDKSLEGIGFHHDSYQSKISDNCKQVVENAYSSIKRD